MKRFVIGLVCLGLAAPAAAQDPLTAARDLYASASYEEALVMLTGLLDGSAPSTRVEQVDQYRAYCLFALGRKSEAQKVAEGLISKNPLLQLDAADVSPRIAAMFTDVRRALLPALVREHYKAARTALDKKDFANAEPEFVQVKAMIDEADRLNIADPTLSDMGVLVDGFLDLTRSSAANVAIDRPAAPPVAAAVTQPEPQTVAADRRIYDISTSDVSAPVIVIQNLPAVPASIVPFLWAGPASVLLDVVIDERGLVERVTVRSSRYPKYDEVVIRATRGWKYQPALKDGMPVKYLKTIFITMQK